MPGPGDQFLHGVPTNTTVNKLTCSHEKYEISVGLRCDVCLKLFKPADKKRRRPQDCKCLTR